MLPALGTTLATSHVSLRDGRPLVYASMGTLQNGQADIFQKIVWGNVHTLLKIPA